MARISALKVIEVLTHHNHQAYLVGGCVRDHLLQLEPRDYDIATSATPSQIRTVFTVYNHEAERFGTIRVYIMDHWIEITTFREDGIYIDGRRPESVTFSDLDHDAKRRDFTINAIYWNPLTNEIVDPVNGVRDLNERILRTIGDPKIRFQEDHLRILRAVRLSASYTLTIEPQTLSAMDEFSGSPVTIPRLRLGEELFKILRSGHTCSALLLMKGIGLSATCFPDLVEDDEFYLCIQRFDSYPSKSIELGLATVFSRSSPGRASAICLELGTSKKVANTVQWLLENMSILLTATTMDPLALRTWLKLPTMDLLFSWATIMSESPSNGLLYCMERRRQFQEHPKQPSSNLINGSDLLKLGYPLGPQIGFILESVSRAKEEGKIDSKETALIWVKKNHPPRQ